MDGFSPNLDLNSLPCKLILYSVDNLRNRGSFFSQAIYDVRFVTVGI